MNTLGYYHGKIRSTVSFVVLMQLQYYNITLPLLGRYLSTEIFNHTCNPDMRKKWFRSCPYGLKAVDSAAEVLGVHEQISVLEVDGFSSLRSMIENNIYHKPFILGPLSMSAVWNTAEAPYFDGYAHFVNVFEMQGDCLMAHDPDGWPYFTITKDMITKMLGYEKMYKISFPSPHIRTLENQSEIYRNILKKIITERLHLIALEQDYGTGLRRLAGILAVRRLKTSEYISLSYIREEMNLSLQFLREFIDLGSSFFQDSVICTVRAITELEFIISNYQMQLQHLQIAVKEHDEKKLVEVLTKCAENEEQLTVYLKNIMIDAGEKDDKKASL